MKRISKEEHKLQKEFLKFSRKTNEEYVYKCAVENQSYINPKKIKRIANDVVAEPSKIQVVEPVIEEAIIQVAEPVVEEIKVAVEEPTIQTLKVQNVVEVASEANIFEVKTIEKIPIIINPIEVGSIEEVVVEDPTTQSIPEPIVQAAEPIIENTTEEAIEPTIVAEEIKL